MHPELLKEIVALCRRRKEQGDHPTEPIADAEVLENAIVQAADEIERLRTALKAANDQAERFERGWYLRGDALEVAVRQNEHDMLMTGDELRACRAALGA